MALALELLQHTASVAAVAQGGVVTDLARPDLEDVQNLVHQDGNVHPRRGLAACDDLLYIGAVLLRVMLLVLLLKRAGVSAPVPGAALVLLFHGINSFSETLSYHSRCQKKSPAALTDRRGAGTIGDRQGGVSSMVTLAQRIEELRTARGLSRPALAAALGLPRTAIEKFETGRQTPTQDQQSKLASYFGVSLFYLRGETNDTTQMSDWMDGAFLDEPAPAPAPKRAVKPVAAVSSGGEGGTMFDAFLTSKKFQEALRTAVLDTLRTPEGQEILAKAIRRELASRQK